MRAKLLIVDDERTVCWSLAEFFKDLGCQAETAGSVEEARGLAAKSPPDVMLLDIILPGESGLQWLDELRKMTQPPAVIVMTAHGGMASAIESMQKGAYDYVTKPFDLEKIKVIVERALEGRQLRAEVVALRSRLQGDTAAAEVMIGRTPIMQDVYKKIGAVAAATATVLITGESGSGKELTARAIHANSVRKDGPFVAINCGALPESLLASELFGHEKGAFTGAVAARAGKFERAQGGTVFLDEIGDITAPMQVALLRFLEDRTIERVGGQEAIQLDVRVIAATHADLAAKVAAGEFREDLYYRLKVLDVHLPALRERQADLLELIAHFLDKSHVPQTELSTPALELLQKHDWPGNVRELRNVIEHAVALARGAVILPEHLPPYLTGRKAAVSGDLKLIDELLRKFVDQAAAQGQPCYESIVSLWEEPLLRVVLEKFGGNQVKTAEFLGIHRTTLRNKMTQYSLDR